MILALNRVIRQREERERNKKLKDYGTAESVRFLFHSLSAGYSVECQTTSCSNSCVCFAMFPIFLVILKFCDIQRLISENLNFKILGGMPQGPTSLAQPE